MMIRPARAVTVLVLIVAVTVGALFLSLRAAVDAPAKVFWPLFGGTPGRNMVNLVDKGIPTKWSIEDKDNIKWVAELGDKCYGGPVIASGKIVVGTNNRNPRDPSIKGSKSVVMCFRKLMAS